MSKILLISFEYPTGKKYCGGVGHIVKQCRDALLESGYEVYVLITREFVKKHPVKLLLPDGNLVRYYNFWAFGKHYDWRNFSYIIQNFVNWTKDLRKLKNSRGQRPRIIYHFHSILRREKDSGFNTFNRYLLNQERMIEIADKVICPSRYEYDNFMRYFPFASNKVFLIENTVEYFLRNRTEVNKIRNLHEIKKGDIVSIYVGRLERIKGADTIINNISRLLVKYKKLKVFIIGKTLERNLYKKLKRVQKRFPNQIFNFHYLEKRILFQYYYMSDIYINSSLSESFSLSTHENAFCNNTLLLHSLPVFEKFKDAAMFFTNHDPQGRDFISKFRRLIRDKRLRCRLSRNSVKIAKDFLSQNRLKQDFLQLFKSF
ncbi:MAG: glycosyltransferase family 4 protein [Candidatus Omnitrophica bacterium]|nr:glycosyltransferase family 4 protein [Candidatus Omnitrophota bacterium]